MIPSPSTETMIASDICRLYQSLIGHAPDLVTCQFISPNQLILIFENSISPVEQLLCNIEQKTLARQVRAQIDRVFQTKLVHLVQQYTQRSVVDILAESKIETGRKSIILVLEPEAIAMADSLENTLLSS